MRIFWCIIQEDYDDTFNYPLDELGVLRRVWALVRSGKLNTPASVCVIKGLFGYLVTAEEIQPEVILLMLNDVVDGLDDVTKSTTNDTNAVMCTSTIRLVLWEIARIIQRAWPSLDYMRPRLMRTVEAEPFVHRLAQAIEANKLDHYVDLDNDARIMIKNGQREEECVTYEDLSPENRKFYKKGLARSAWSL
ncbi:hypothetical protein VTJ04DRAFT_1939 [Mycothermus thermophilus]|uniref:uncharacterized protein n=1 Tax=Humicola insolens TaxID=85995 RepID=UPI0037449931